MTYVVDSFGTDLAASSGPHGISLSTTMDDDIFIDGMLRGADEKTPDSQEEVSERSMVKVSPGAVRQEVSQAISDKKGMLIILKEVEDKEEAKEISSVSEKEEPVVPREAKSEENEISTSKELEDTALVWASFTTEVKSQSPKMGTQNDDMPQIKGTDSPKKAMASWISDEGKAEVISVTTKEVQGMKTSGDLQIADIFTFEEEQSRSNLTQITVSESSATTLAVVLYEY